MKKELYFSTDIETDGPIPGDNSMLSLGTVVFTEEGEEIDSFSANLEPLPGAFSNGETMEWWKKHQDAYWATRTNTELPADVFLRYLAWVESLTGEHKAHAVFVAYPAGFDFTFVYWYSHHFCRRCPFGFQALDMKSFTMALLGTPFRETTKKNMPKEWFPQLRHLHLATEDAREQGLLFINQLRESRNARKRS